MVWLVEVFCYIKARWQAAQLSVNYSANLGICSLVLVIVCKLFFYLDCLTYMDICIYTYKSFSFTLFSKDSKFRRCMHVSILILARWNLFACTKWRQQQLSHCLHIPFCESVLI